METKICKGIKYGCGRRFPITSFYKKKSGGYYNLCRECYLGRITKKVEPKDKREYVKVTGIDYKAFCTGCWIYDERTGSWDGDFCYNTGCLKRELR